MRFTEESALIMLVIGAFAVIGISILSEVSMDGYNRYLYQKSYQKNTECRISYRGSASNYIDQVCGPLPKFEDFVK